MKINFNKFKEITDELFHRPSTHITALFGLFLLLCWAPGEIIASLNEPETETWLTSTEYLRFFFLPTIAILLVLYGIECKFKKLRINFKIMKFFTLTFAAIFTITMITIAAIFLFIWQENI